MKGEEHYAELRRRAVERSRKRRKARPGETFTRITTCPQCGNAFRATLGQSTCVYCEDGLPRPSA